MKFVGVFSLLLWLNSAQSFAQVPPSTAATDVVQLNQEEYQFYLMINKFRSLLGLPTFQIHVYLQNAAKKHSEWMASQTFLTHYGPTTGKTPFQRMKEEGYVNYTSTGENIACGNADAVKTFRQWAFSPGHLRNMIDPHFRHMGIARAGTGDEQCPYFWTNDFGSMSDPRLDQPEITDLVKISAAVENVSGPIPADKRVLLPSSQTQQNGVNDESETEDTESPDFSYIQCMIPYASAKNTLSFVPNTDALMDLTPNNLGSYKAKISYIQNGAAVNYYPLYINNVSVIKNGKYPLVLIFAGATNRTGSFLIQFDLSTSAAKFDPYPSTNGDSGAVLCSYKN